MLYTDHAAARAFEYGIDHAALLDALGGDHFSQEGYADGQVIHFVKVEERPIKVVTAPHNQADGATAIITIVPLDLDAST